MFLCLKYFFLKNDYVFRSKILDTNVNHLYETRQVNKLRLPLYKTNLTQKSLLFLGPKIWNNLPCDVKNKSSLSAFKRKLKLYMTQLY